MPRSAIVDKLIEDHHVSKQPSATSIADLIRRCDEEIRQGQAHSIEPLITALNLAKIPRADMTGLAKICRRAALYSLGIKILAPVVRQKNAKLKPATIEEQCEYAALLARNGSPEEAIALLKTLDANQHPEVYLQTALSHIPLWEYRAAIPGLKTYIDLQSEFYPRLIARVNLVACFVTTQAFDEAIALIAEIMRDLELNPAPRILANCLELRAQVRVGQGNLITAKTDLEEAARIFRNEKTMDQLVVEKWRAIILALETTNLEPLNKLIPKVYERKHWNTLREIDFYSLKIEFKQKVFDKLYFGSPFSAYRDRLRNEFQHEPSATLTLGEHGLPCFDLRQGKIDGSIGLNPGKKIHHVLNLLTRDLYAPASVAALFAGLHPEQYFDIFSSPARIYQLIYRTRSWIESSAIPMSIDAQDEGYILRPGANLAFRLSLERPLRTKSLDIKTGLEVHFGDGEAFSSAKAAETLGVSKSSMDRSLQQFLKEGDVQTERSGRALKYRLKKKQKLISNL